MARVFKKKAVEEYLNDLVYDWNEEFKENPEDELVGDFDFEKEKSGDEKEVNLDAVDEDFNEDLNDNLERCKDNRESLETLYEDEKQDWDHFRGFEQNDQSQVVVRDL